MQHKLKNIILIITFIWLGFIAIIAQTLCFRELMVIFFGNELCLGIIFTAWLLGITLGAFFASFIIDKIKSSTSLLTALLLLIIFILPFQVYSIRLIRLIINIPIGQHIPFFETVYMSFITVMPFSIIIGIAFPVACKIYALLKGKIADAALQISWVYIWEAIGSLIGGVLFTFYLVEHYSVFGIILASNFISVTIAFLVYCQFERSELLAIIPSMTRGYLTASARKTISLIIFLILVASNLIITLKFTASIENKSILKRWQSLAGENMALVKSTNSKYANIAIGSLNEQYSLFENGKYVSSFPDDYTYAPLAHLFLTQHPQPQDVLLIGGGIEGIIKEMLNHPIKTLDYVQLDPKIIEIESKYLLADDMRLLRADKRLQIHYIDGRLFIKTHPAKFDIIIINLPDPSTAMINRFYTIDFFNEAKLRLNKGGVMITRVSSAVNYFSETVGNYTGSVYDTLTSVFKYVLVTPGTDAYFFASDEPDTVTFNISTLDQRYRSIDIESRYFISPASFEMMLREWDIKFTQQALAKQRKHYLNTDLQPITYFFNLILWDKITRKNSSATTFLQMLSGIKFHWIIVLLFILFIVRLIYLKITSPVRSEPGQRNEAMREFRDRTQDASNGVKTHQCSATAQPAQASLQKSNSLISIFIIGLSGLSLELISIIIFQNVYGYLYQYIGFMVALFMAGLAVGGYLSNIYNEVKPDRIVAAGFSLRNLRTLKGAATPFKQMIIIHFLIFMIPIFISYILPLCSLYIIIFILIVFIGMITGMAYPVISRIYLKSGAETGKTAGLIDSFDHLGACLGAILIGVFFIPIFGINNTCIFIALINFGAVFLLLPCAIGRSASGGY
jgi:spermidine synthase